MISVSIRIISTAGSRTTTDVGPSRGCNNIMNFVNIINCLHRSRRVSITKNVHITVGSLTAYIRFPLTFDYLHFTFNAYIIENRFKWNSSRVSEKTVIARTIVSFAFNYIGSYDNRVRLVAVRVYRNIFSPLRD
jgi:hypothetical protein